MRVRAAERERFFARLSLLLGCALLGVICGGLWSKLRPRQPEVVHVPPPAPSPFGVHPDAGTGPVTPIAMPPDLALPLPDAGAYASRELWVLVVDSAGQPVEGVSVLARPGMLTVHSATGNGSSIGELGVLPGALPFPDEVIAGQSALAGRIERSATSSPSVWVMRSDRSGHARFSSLPSGRLLLLANYQGKSASAEVELPQQAAAARAESSLRVVLRLASPVECADPLLADSSESSVSALGLSARTDLHGRVLDHRGFAVASARVEVQVGAARQQATTDVRGQFALPMLPAGDARVTVRAPGFAPLVQVVKMDQRRDEARVELRPGGGIAGQIEDARTSGLPEGLEVWLELPSGERMPISVAADGHFAQTGVPTGPVVVKARARGYAPVQKSVHVSEGASPDQITVRDIRLRFVRGAQLLGQVRLAGSRIEGADVVILTEEGVAVSRGRTDVRGEFELSDLPPGKLKVSVSSSQGGASQIVELRPSDRQRVELELGSR